MIETALMCVCCWDLVVVSIGDGVGCDSRLLHLQQDSDGEDRLTVLTAQLHQDPVTHLKQHNTKHNTTQNTTQRQKIRRYCEKTDIRQEMGRGRTSDTRGMDENSE